MLINFVCTIWEIPPQSIKNGIKIVYNSLSRVTYYQHIDVEVRQTQVSVLAIY